MKTVLFLVVGLLTGCAGGQGVAVDVLNAMSGYYGNQSAYYQGRADSGAVDYYQQYHSQQPKNYSIQPVIMGNGRIGGYNVIGR